MEFEELKRHRRLIIGLITFFLVSSIIAWVKRDAITQSIKFRQSNRLLEKVAKARENGDLVTAMQMASAAQQLNPGNVEALHTLLLIHTAQSSPQVLNLASQLFYHPKATVDDRARSLGVFLDNGDLRLFWQNFESLSLKEKNHPDILYLYAGYLAYQSEAEMALNVLSQGPKDDPRFNILKVALLSIAHDVPTRDAGQEELARLIASTDPRISEQAFRQVRTIPLRLRNATILKPAVDQWIEDRKDGMLTLSDRLTQRSFEFLEESSDLDNPGESLVIKRVITEIGQAQPILVSNWLLRLGLSDIAYDLATEAVTTSETDREASAINLTLFDVKNRAFAESKRWEEQLALLDSAPAGVAPLNIALMRAVALKHIGQTTEARLQWQQAFRLAELTNSRRNSYLDIYRWANRSGELDLAIRAMVEACKSTMGVLPSTSELTQLIVYLAENDRDDDLIAMTDGLFRREAFSDALVNNALYLRELTGNSVPHGIEISQHLISRAPEVVGFHTTLILSHLNRNQFDEALKVAEHITRHHRMEDLPPSETVIIAGAYRQADKKHLFAERNLDQNLEALLNIEKHVFQKWFEEK